MEGPFSINSKAKEPSGLLDKIVMFLLSVYLVLAR
jgi:hypothetical protein